MEVPVVEFVDGARKRRNSNAKERKLFMSPKASDVVKVLQTPAEIQQQPSSHKEFELDFNNIFRRVENLGNSQLCWKEKKKLEESKLVGLGAKPRKNCKVPIDVARERKRKRDEKEEMKRQEDIAAGNYVKKIASKDRRRSKGDKGLRFSEGRFKGGVLYVKPFTPTDSVNKRDHQLNTGKRTNNIIKPKQQGKTKRC